MVKGFDRQLIAPPLALLFRKTPSIKMALARSVYNLLFRRTSTFAITIMVGAVFFERMFDQGGDAVFDNINRGVSGFLLKYEGVCGDPTDRLTLI